MYFLPTRILYLPYSSSPSSQSPIFSHDRQDNTFPDPRANIDTNAEDYAQPVADTSITAELPSPEQFNQDRDKRWTLTPLPGTDSSQSLGEGAIYSNTIHRLGWDKGRSSRIGKHVFWNFGDVLSVDGIAKGSEAGFCMGAAFYADPANPLLVDTKRAEISSVTDQDFVRPWTGHPSRDPPLPDDWFWGMDTSNVVPVSGAHGIGYAWEIHRKPDGSCSDKGAAIFVATLGPKMPEARRFGPLATGPDAVQIGILGVLNPNVYSPAPPHADGYIYAYTIGDGAWDPAIVARVRVENAFDIERYQFLLKGGGWDAEGVVPKRGDKKYGMEGLGEDGKACGGPVSNSQGSVVWNHHLNKYMLFYGTMAHFAGFWTSDTPWGPWRGEYKLLESEDDGKMHYGVNCHPDLLPASNGKEMLVSWGTDNIVTMYKLKFDY